jgi:hypothetical protein
VLDRLQRLLSRPVFSLPHGRLYKSYRERLQAAGLPQPEVRALSAVYFARLSLNVAVLRSPLLRTRRTGDPDTSIRAAALSGQLARLLLRDRQALSWLQAVPFELEAASADRAAQERCDTLRASCIDSSRTLYPLPRLRWPGQSLPSIRKSRMR